MEQSSLWKKCLESLEDELSSQQFNTWVRPLRANQDGDCLRVFAPNRFVQEWVRDRFLARIGELAEQLAGNPVRVMVEIGAPAGPEVVAATNPGVAADVAAPGERRPLASGSRLNPEFTFETHVEGKSNQLARAAARQVGENPGRS